jgi:diaminohydroxyphosphoribosylaminopyrimidine deaminase/5-amino-6-(5-phosphoribosylamino)uracil reductase
MNSTSDSRIPPADPDLDALFMGRALELAARGEGFVEPNPMVGCVIVRDGVVIGEGWHQRFGGLHAEVEALRVGGVQTTGATAYVTLEPCCHHGKTPPCTEALIAADIARVVCAQRDPYEKVGGRGIAVLQAAGIQVDIGLMESEARRINAPYLKLVSTGRPWVIAKWAMTLDGKIAAHTGDSRWISCEASRAIVQQLRGRMDAIVVGHNTAEQDDPLLIARPPGPRVATRIVVDGTASLSLESQLVRTVNQAPVLIAVGSRASNENISRLKSYGCEIVCCGNAEKDADPTFVSIPTLLAELGRRRMTNVLVEGGAQLLGSLFDAGAIDEVHVFIAPKLIGGENAPSPIGGAGIGKIAAAMQLADPLIRQIGADLYLSGRIARP